MYSDIWYKTNCFTIATFQTTATIHMKYSLLIIFTNVFFLALRLDLKKAGDIRKDLATRLENANNSLAELQRKQTSAGKPYEK